MSKYLLLLSLMLLSCETKNDKIIDKKIMLEVLVDLHLNDAIIQINSTKTPSVQVQMSQYDSVIERHGISRPAFEWNVAYYTYNKELDGIMDKVIDTLNKIESDIQKEIIDLKDSNTVEKQ